MEQFFSKGNKRLLVLFHGTGGDQTSLLYVSGEVDAKASVLAFEGDVGRGSDRRFFAPLRQGQVDWTDYQDRVDHFWQTWDRMDLSTYEEVYAIGYSNGANFLLGLIKERPQAFQKVLLLHPAALGWQDHPGPGRRVEWFVTLGAMDNLTPPGPVIQWLASLANSAVRYKIFDGGHGVTDPELDWLRGLVNGEDRQRLGPSKEEIWNFI